MNERAIRRKAASLLADARDCRYSKNSRNACISAVRRLEATSGLTLYPA